MRYLPICEGCPTVSFPGGWAAVSLAASPQEPLASLLRYSASTADNSRSKTDLFGSGA